MLSIGWKEERKYCCCDCTWCHELQKASGLIFWNPQWLNECASYYISNEITKVEKLLATIKNNGSLLKQYKFNICPTSLINSLRRVLGNQHQYCDWTALGPLSNVGSWSHFWYGTGHGRNIQIPHGKRLLFQARCCANWMNHWIHKGCLLRASL